MAILKHDAIMKMILAQGNAEQNAFYPPSVYDQHIRLVTNFILDYAVKNFAVTQSVIDTVNPFQLKQDYKVVNGVVDIPVEYRNLLGISFNVTEDFKNDCGCGDNEEKKFENDPLAESERERSDRIIKAKCISRNVKMVDIDEYDYLTTHPYKKPTFKNAIGCIAEKKKIKICPADISSVSITFLKNPKEYVYGYVTLPDDTFIYDPNASVESEWDENATQLIVKGMTALYSIYTRDGDMQDWSAVLNKLDIF